MGQPRPKPREAFESVRARLHRTQPQLSSERRDQIARQSFERVTRQRSEKGQVGPKPPEL